MSHSSDAEGCGCILIFVVLVVVCFFGISSCDNYERTSRINKEVEKKEVFLKPNNNQYRVLYIYPKHFKGHETGRSVVMEGVKDKVRIESNFYPTLPIPEEIWEVRVSRDGYTAFYEFVRKIE